MMKLTKSSRAFRRATAFILAAAMTLSAPVATQASAASKKKVPSLSVKKKTLYYNKAGKKSFTLKIKKNKVKKIVKTKWTTSKKSVVKISAKKKTKVKVTAIKKGSAKIKAKVTYRVKAGSKAKTKTLTCKVTSKKQSKPAPATETPATSGTPATDTPPVDTKKPDETQKPADETKKPTDETPAPEELKVTAVTVVTSSKVNVTFSKAIDKTTDSSKFSLSDGGVVSSVSVSEDGTVATLTITNVTPDKEYTLTVAGVVSGNLTLQKYEGKFTAIKDEYKLELDTGLNGETVMKADGKTSTTITAKIVNGNGEVVEAADEIELEFYSTAGTFASDRVTVQNGIATNTFTSESLDAPKTAKIMVTIISTNESNKDLINESQTVNILFDPNPESNADESLGATLTDIRVRTADKIALFFNKEVKVTDYTKNDAATKNIYGYDVTKMAITVTDKATAKDKRNITVLGLSQIPGNNKGLYAHLSSPYLTDNSDIEVEVTDKTKKVPVTEKHSALLQDITNPAVLKVENDGLAKIRITFSESVNPGTAGSGARNIANYVVDGVSLNNHSYWGTGTAINVGGFNLETGADTKHIVEIKLGKEDTNNDGILEQIYLKSGYHSVEVSNVGDFANITDINRNKLTTQSLDLHVDEDNSLVSATVEVQSPEQYLVTLSKDLGSEEDVNILATLKQYMTLQKWDNDTSKYVDVVPAFQTIKIRREWYPGDGVRPSYASEAQKKTFVVEVEKDWTIAYDTATNGTNYYSGDKYRLYIPADKIVNPSNGKKNAEIDMPLDITLDVESPKITGVTGPNDNGEYSIGFSEPVQVPGSSFLSKGAPLTPNQRQVDINGIPKPLVQFISADNKTTIGSAYCYNQGQDKGIAVKPDKALTPGIWKVVVSSISDDVGNTAATLVQDNFEVKAPAVAKKTFRPLWIVAVPAGHKDPVRNKNVGDPGINTDDVIYVKYSDSIRTSGAGSATDPAHYQIDGGSLPIESKLKADIPDYNMDVINIYTRDAMHDTVAIHLPTGTLVDDHSNTVYLADTMISASGEKITGAGQKTLGKVNTSMNAYFTWNYETKSTADTPAVIVTDADRAAKLQAFLDNDENVNASIEAAKLKNDLELTIKKEMTVDFNSGAIKTLKIDTQSTGRIVVKNLNATTITINAPNADVYFEGVQVSGTGSKVDLQNILAKLDLNGAGRAVTISELNIKNTVTHNISVTGSARGDVTLTTVNEEVKDGVTVTYDPLTIGTLNVKSKSTAVLDDVAVTTVNLKSAAKLNSEGSAVVTTLNVDEAATLNLKDTTVTTLNVTKSGATLNLDDTDVTTLNVKAAAKLSLKGDSDITNTNLAKDVKFTECKLDTAGGSSLGTVTTGMTANSEGALTGGTVSGTETDYVAGEGIEKLVPDLAVALTSGTNFVSKNACSLADITSGSALTATNYNLNTQLTIQLPASTSIKDYKGISFKFETPVAFSSSWQGFWIQMPKSPATEIAAASFQPKADGVVKPINQLNNVIIANQAVDLAANTKKEFKLPFNWKDESSIIAAQLNDAAEIKLGFQIEGVESGTFKITEVKLYDE